MSDGHRFVIEGKTDVFPEELRSWLADLGGLSWTRRWGDGRTCVLVVPDQRFDDVLRSLEGGKLDFYVALYRDRANQSCQLLGPGYKEEERTRESPPGVWVPIGTSKRRL